MRVIATCYERKNEPHNAEAWYYRAAAEAPMAREPWCHLAQLFYNQGRWIDCYSSAMRALSIKNRELVYTCDPSSWGEWPHDLAAISAWHLGLKDAAQEQGELAVKLNPDDKRLQENLLWFRGEKG
jgi:tetratricopeptide (TPR) repeat protein